VSEDGVHFTQRPQPVFSPADDAQRSREAPGGWRIRASWSRPAAGT
jgi:hypothetical protein